MPYMAIHDLRDVRPQVEFLDCKITETTSLDARSSFITSQSTSRTLLRFLAAINKQLPCRSLIFWPVCALIPVRVNRVMRQEEARALRNIGTDKVLPHKTIKL
jgi:hypothetical protein